ncbi:hypothetical protein [Hufsiella ginkgonis]|uniref:Uncharacterized protein n=1 Tax=Hufsiella ginkgonis TaxID=2695274 RepID=A0A7K1XW99_9SPHI|nr:hypothetical protein [Hufsiella ginkgonis]MXV15272.1 hypothetical protein [Hufsiella ginkgonis]
MNSTSKKIFLGLTIVVPFLIYCVYYYGMMIKNAPYQYSELESITLKYGAGTGLVNQYDSKTGAYQYLDDKDSLIKTTLRLREKDLKYLHTKARKVGFWNFPEVLESNDSVGAKNDLHYYLEFKYARKSKRLLFSTGFNRDQQLADAAKSLVDEVEKSINDAEDRVRRAKTN